MIRSIALAICSLCFTTAFAQHEVMYHISTRSFFDSNGDGIGDLKGIQQKLDYLQQFGVNTITLSPVYQSEFYHNLYATDLEKLDAGYGAFKEYRDLIQNIHLRKMKLYQEVDLQYVSAKHSWFSDSFKNTKSVYSGYIYFTDTKNEKPFLLPDITTYKEGKEQVAAVNLKSPKVLAYYEKALKYWVDPNGDGNFNDGVDGFRVVDAKDKLDNSGKTSNQFRDFYMPLLASLKKVNPALQLLAEPVDSATAENDFFAKANFDRVMANGLRNAIVSLDKNKIVKAADSVFKHLSSGKVPVVYLENNNTERVASVPGMNLGKLKAIAGLNFLIGGVPCIYYGQEIGIMGTPAKTGTDGDKIPLTEAFEWYAAGEGQGTASWYKGTQWWENGYAKPSDGVSLEEQQKDTNSLWSYYKQLIRMKKMQKTVAEGSYESLLNSNDKVVSFIRKTEGETVLVMINLSGEDQFTRIDDSCSLVLDKLKLVFGTPNVTFTSGARGLVMTPYSVQVWRTL